MLLDTRLAKLVEMGYDADGSARALQASNGSIVAAVAILFGDSGASASKYFLMVFPQFVLCECFALDLKQPVNIMGELGSRFELRSFLRSTCSVSTLCVTLIRTKQTEPGIFLAESTTKHAFSFKSIGEADSTIHKSVSAHLSRNGLTVLVFTLGCRTVCSRNFPESLGVCLSTHLATQSVEYTLLIVP